MSDNFVRVGDPVVVVARYASRVERGVIHEMVELANCMEAIKAVRVGPDEDVKAGGGTILRVPKEAQVLSIIPPRRKVVQFEAKLLIEVEVNKDADEQEVSDTVRGLLTESLETFESVDLTGCAEGDVDISLLYFDDYEEDEADARSRRNAEKAVERMRQEESNDE